MSEAEREMVRIEDGVRESIAEVMGRKVSEVRLESLLMHELRAESLDFLDIVFNLEQKFGIEITRGQIVKAARGDLTDEEFAPAGVVSEVGLARLRELMPEAAERIRPGLRAGELLTLFSVQTFVNIVRERLRGAT